jgi:hypothetical protein
MRTQHPQGWLCTQPVHNHTCCCCCCARVQPPASRFWPPACVLSHVLHAAAALELVCMGTVDLQQWSGEPARLGNTGLRQVNANAPEDDVCCDTRARLKDPQLLKFETFKSETAEMVGNHLGPPPRCSSEICFCWIRLLPQPNARQGFAARAQVSPSEWGVWPTQALQGARDTLKIHHVT